MAILKYIQRSLMSVDSVPPGIVTVTVIGCLSIYLHIDRGVTYAVSRAACHLS